MIILTKVASVFGQNKALRSLDIGGPPFCPSGEVDVKWAQKHAQDMPSKGRKLKNIQWILDTFINEGLFRRYYVDIYNTEGSYSAATVLAQADLIPYEHRKNFNVTPFLSNFVRDFSLQNTTETHHKHTNIYTKYTGLSLFHFMHTACWNNCEKTRHNRQYKGTSHKTPWTITRSRHLQCSQLTCANQSRYAPWEILARRHLANYLNILIKLNLSLSPSLSSGLTHLSFYRY